jgi:hypothetical protein
VVTVTEVPPPLETVVAGVAAVDDELVDDD